MRSQNFHNRNNGDRIWWASGNAIQYERRKCVLVLLRPRLRHTILMRVGDFSIFFSIVLIYDVWDQCLALSLVRNRKCCFASLECNLKWKNNQARDCQWYSSHMIGTRIVWAKAVFSSWTMDALANRGSCAIVCWLWCVVYTNTECKNSNFTLESRHTSILNAHCFNK